MKGNEVLQGTARKKLYDTLTRKKKKKLFDHSLTFKKVNTGLNNESVCVNIHVIMIMFEQYSYFILEALNKTSYFQY